MRKKIVFASLAFLIPCLLANVSIETENYNVSSDMINQLVYADSMTFEDVEARVVFSLSELDNIETTAQSAISSASNEYIAEQEKKFLPYWLTMALNNSKHTLQAHRFSHISIKGKHIRLLLPSVYLDDTF